jgi:adenosine deaminase CECR1
MPKGALLHVHLDATVEVSFLLQLALNHHAVHVRTASALSPQTIASALPEFRVLPESEFTSLESLTDPAYPANGWVPLKLARQNFALGGERGFDQWFQAAVTINPAEAYGTHKTVTKVGSAAFFGSLFITSSLRSGKNSRALSQ